MYNEEHEEYQQVLYLLQSYIPSKTHRGLRVDPAHVSSDILSSLDVLFLIKLFPNIPGRMPPSDLSALFKSTWLLCLAWWLKPRWNYRGPNSGLDSPLLWVFWCVTTADVTAFRPFTLGLKTTAADKGKLLFMPYWNL